MIGERTASRAGAGRRTKKCSLYQFVDSNEAVNGRGALIERNQWITMTTSEGGQHLPRLIVEELSL